MNRNTLIAFGAFAALGLVALVLLRQPEKGARQGERPRPMAALKAGDVDTLEITKGKDTTVLKRDGDKFKLAAPLSYPAEDYAAKQAFEAIEKLEFGDVVTDQTAKHAEFEVGADGLRVVAKKGGTVLADLVVGKAANAYTMIRATGKNEVWQAVGSLKATYDKTASGWRDKSITTFKPDEVETLAVASHAGKIVLKKDAPEGGKPGAGDDAWSVVESAVKVATLDKTVPAGIVSALSAFKANDFADGAKPEETGLADATFTITVGLKGGKSVTALIGSKKNDDDTYVKAGDGPQIFTVKKYALERLTKRPIEFRDKTVCNLPEASVEEVSVSHGADSFTLVKKGGDWKASKPAGLELDSSKVTPLVSAFKEWKGLSFAEDPSPKATGLAKPQAVIVAKGKGKDACTLKIGDETKEKNGYFAQPQGSSDVYVLAKWGVDRVLKKIDDIKKPGTTLGKK